MQEGGEVTSERGPITAAAFFTNHPNQVWLRQRRGCEWDEAAWDLAVRQSVDSGPPSKATSAAFSRGAHAEGALSASAPSAAVPSVELREDDPNGFTYLRGLVNSQQSSFNGVMIVLTLSATGKATRTPAPATVSGRAARIARGLRTRRGESGSGWASSTRARDLMSLTSMY